MATSQGLYYWTRTLFLPSFCHPEDDDNQFITLVQFYLVGLRGKAWEGGAESIIKITLFFFFFWLWVNVGVLFLLSM